MKGLRQNAPLVPASDGLTTAESKTRSDRMAIDPPDSNKIRNLAIVCSFLIILIHCRPEFASGSLAWYVKEMTENGISEMAVPFFFIVSGVMLGQKLARGEGMARSWGWEVFKRLKTLVVPFFIWNALYWLVTQLGPFIHMHLLGRHCGWPTIPSPRQFGLWHTECPLLTPLWYVRALFVLVLLSPLLHWVLRKTGGYILLLLFALYGIVCPYYPMSDWNALKNFARVGILPVLGLFYFSFGLAISMKFIETKRISLSPWLSLSLGLILMFLRAVCQDISFLRGACYLGFFALPFLLYGAWQLIPSGKWPDCLVKNAFPVFLIHKFGLWFIRNKRIPLEHGVISFLVCALAVFISSLFAANVIRRFFPKCSTLLFGGR